MSAYSSTYCSAVDSAYDLGTTHLSMCQHLSSVKYTNNTDYYIKHLESLMKDTKSYYYMLMKLIAHGPIAL